MITFQEFSRESEVVNYSRSCSTWMRRRWYQQSESRRGREKGAAKCEEGGYLKTLPRAIQAAAAAGKYSTSGSETIHKEHNL